MFKFYIFFIKGLEKSKNVYRFWGRMGCVRGRIVCSCIWIRVSWMLRKLSVIINFLKKYNVKIKIEIEI